MTYPYPARTHIQGAGNQVIHYKATGTLAATSSAVSTFDIPPGHYEVGGVLSGAANNKALKLKVAPYIAAVQTGTNASKEFGIISCGVATVASSLTLAINAGISGKVFVVTPVPVIASAIPIPYRVCAPYGLKITVSSTVGTGAWTLELIATEV